MVKTKWTPEELRYLASPPVRVNVLYTCGHEEIISQGMRQSDYSFNEGIKKRHAQSCMDCQIQSEQFWTLIKSRLMLLKKEYS